ncbi:MAG: S8 family serine peptidase [Bacteroidia bacterium]|nr:S8 family serine peptidase [Bacteroidia bacterium]
MLFRILFRSVFGLAVALLIAQTSHAQELYYWSSGVKHRLAENPQSVILYLNQEVPEAALRMSARAGDAPVLGYGANGVSRLVVDLPASLRAADPDAAARASGVDPALLRSAAFGLSLEEDPSFTMWPTYRIVYRPGKLFDRSRMMELLGAGDWSFGETGGGIRYIQAGDLAQVLPAANRLYESGMFEWCHPDFASIAHGQSYVPNYSCPPAGFVLPSDPYMNVQYYLHNTGSNSNSVYPYRRNNDIDIDAPEAWCLSLGDSNIIVAVVDEGVEAHEDLVDYNGSSRLLTGYTTSDPAGVGEPRNNNDAHGQAVAGIIAASHNNLGGAGIAPNVKILPVHVYIDGVSSPSEFADAISWAWQNGADVINNSWAYSVCSQNLYPVIDQAILDAVTLGRGGKGAVVTFSAGQSTVSRSCIAYPSNSPYVITTGAVDQRARRTNYSREGSQLDLVAPSSIKDSIEVNVTVMDRMGDLGYNFTGIPYTDYTNRNYTMWFGGTSVSCAQTSGVSALVLSVNPNLTYTEVRNTLITTADNMGAAGFDTIFGHGRLNAYAAVSSASTNLPVEWLSFRGWETQAGVLLEWVTVSETGNAYYAVERIANGQAIELGRVAGAGTTADRQTYTFEDRRPLPGLNVYRLRQVDQDGSQSFSSLVEIWTEPGGAAMLSVPYPNPASDAFTFELLGLAGQEVRWSLLDLQGRAMYSAVLVPQAAVEAVPVQAASLPAGMYVLRVESGGHTPALQRVTILK